MSLRESTSRADAICSGDNVERRAHERGRARVIRLARTGAQRVRSSWRCRKSSTFTGQHAVRAPDHEQIGGLEITVNDAERVGPRRWLRTLGARTPPLARTGSAPRWPSHAARSLPSTVLHHHVGRAVFELAHVAHLGDVLALDLHCRSGFTREAQHRLFVVEYLGEQEFDRDPLVEGDVVRRDDHGPYRPRRALRSIRYLPASRSPARTPGGTVSAHRGGSENTGSTQPLAWRDALKLGVNLAEKHGPVQRRLRAGPEQAGARPGVSGSRR